MKLISDGYKKTICFLCILFSILAFAADGVWISDSGVWTDPANWEDGIVAQGTGAKATFANAMTVNSTVSIDGSADPVIVGEIEIGETGKNLTISATNDGRLTFDNGESAAVITTATGNFGTIDFSTPVEIAGNKKLEVSNNYGGDRTLQFTGDIFGDDVIIANCGTGNNSLVLISGTKSFTGELHAESTYSRLNVQFNGVEERAGGDPRNAVRIFPGGRLTLARYGHAVVNPLRTIILEGGDDDVPGIFYNPGEGNEKKHVPANITGDGSLSINGYCALSGLNTFTGTMELNSAMLQVASEANLGKGKLVVHGNGTSLRIIGREYSSLGDRDAEFNNGNNGGTYISIVDPEHVFEMDRGLAMSLNSAGAPSFAKNGPGELQFTAPQTFRNVTGRMLAVDGGTVTVDYTAGGSLHGSSTTDHNTVGFKGGTLNLSLKDSADDFIQNFRDLRLDGDGARIIIENTGASGSFTMNCRNAIFNSPGSNKGLALDIKVTGDASKVFLTTEDENDEDTGIWGGGRIVFLESDWPSVEEGTDRIVKYDDYSLLANAGPDDNALVDGNGTIASDTTINTLKVTTQEPGQSLSIADSTTLTLDDNAILFTGDHDYTLDGGVIRNGRDSTDFLLHHFGSGTITLNSCIDGMNGITSFAKTGPGKAVLASKSQIGGTVVIADGILEISDPASIMYTNGILMHVTSTNTSPVFTCTAEELPFGFLPGSSILNRTVQFIDGGPGAWTITLNGNANAPLEDSDASFTTRPTVRNNATLRLTESMTLQNTLVYGGNGAKFDIADGKTVNLPGSKSQSDARSECIFILNNTDPIGDGVARVAGTIHMGSGLYIYRGVYEVDADNISSPGNNPVVFGDGEIATLRIRGGKQFLVPELSGTNRNAIVETHTSGTTTLGVLNGADNEFAGTIRDGTGIIRLVKGGGGVLTLGGDNTYSGSTFINGGGIVLNGSVDGDIEVNSGLLAGTGMVRGNLTINDGATMTTDVTPSITGDITVSGKINIDKIESVSVGNHVLFQCDGTAMLDDASVANAADDDHRMYSLRAGAGKVLLSISESASIILVR